VIFAVLELRLCRPYTWSCKNWPVLPLTSVNRRVRTARTAKLRARSVRGVVVDHESAARGRQRVVGVVTGDEGELSGEALPLFLLVGHQLDAERVGARRDRGLRDATAVCGHQRRLFVDAVSYSDVVRTALTTACVHTHSLPSHPLYSNARSHYTGWLKKVRCWF